MSHETAGQDIVDTLKGALEAERAKIANDRVLISEERLKLKDAIAEANARTAPPKPSMWAEWSKPGAILPLTFFAIAAFATYTHDQALMTKSLSDVAANLATLASRVDRDEIQTTERVRDFVPMIQSNKAAVDQMTLINKGQDERASNLARGLEDMRVSVEKLRDAIQQTHEEMMIDRARREKESRLRPQIAPEAGAAGR